MGNQVHHSRRLTGEGGVHCEVLDDEVGVVLAHPQLGLQLLHPARVRPKTVGSVQGHLNQSNELS